jgi:uncharacterized protein YbaP (TraB family)
MEVFSKTGLYQDDRTLPAEIGAADFERIKTFLSVHGIALANLEKLQPWVVVLMLQLTAPATGGPDGKSALGMGVDRYFIARAKAGEKSIVSLETLREQIDAFSSASDELQKRELRRTMTALERGASPMMEVVNAYFEGTAEQVMAKELDEAEEDTEARAYWKRLLDDRNIEMVKRIHRLFAAGKRPMVVVGAAHMWGPNGIPELLAKDGCRVSPVSPTGEKVVVAPIPEVGKALPTLRVVEHKVEWPSPPVKTPVTVGGADIDVTMCASPPIRYLLTSSSVPPTIILSLDKLYEQGRLSTEQQLQIELRDVRQVKVSGLTADQFVGVNEQIEVHALQVWADSKLYSLVAVAPVMQLNDSMRQQIGQVLDSFDLVTYTQEEADAHRQPAMELLRTKPEWLIPHPTCPEQQAKTAANLTPGEVNHCAPNLHACVVACRDGDALSCVRAADTIVEEEGELADALNARACSLGLAEGCTGQAASLLFDEERSEQWPCAMRVLHEMCEHGEPWACTMYGMGAQKGHGVARDSNEAQRAFMRACEVSRLSSACKRARNLQAQIANEAAASENEESEQ